MSYYPKSSPWGRVQSHQWICEGILAVSTAGHGGFYVAPSKLAELPNNVRYAKRFNSPGSWYEEDAEAYIVMVAFPEVCNALKIDRNIALDGLNRWYPKIAEALTSSA
jgi:hypothetical protein